MTYFKMKFKIIVNRSIKTTNRMINWINLNSNKVLMNINYPIKHKLKK